MANYQTVNRRVNEKKKVRKREKSIAYFDYSLLAILICLICFGLVMLYSTSSYSAMMNIHLKILDGINDHHKAEALFKAFGKALDMATMEEPRIKEAWTTKGSL